MIFSHILGKTISSLLFFFLANLWDLREYVFSILRIIDGKYRAIVVHNDCIYRLKIQ